MKNHFNDFREYGVTWKVGCCDCRCETIITVNQYPHGPNKITCCPICNNTETSIRLVKDNKTEELSNEN